MGSIARRIREGDYPKTREEAIQAKKNGDVEGAAIFWGYYMAPRRGDSEDALGDVFYSALLLNKKLPPEITKGGTKHIVEEWRKMLEDM